MRLVVFGLVLLFAACNLPPVVFHDGLPAQVPGPDRLALRGQMSVMYWSESDDDPAFVPGFMTLGARMGSDVGPVAVEGGAGLLGVSVPYFHLGVGSGRPAVMMRGLVFADGWWQASFLAGPPRRSSGFNWSAGLGASRLGFGPNLVLENRWGDFTLRGQGSVTWRAPWADSMVKGSVVSLGLGVEPSIALKRKATADTTKPR